MIPKKENGGLELHCCRFRRKELCDDGYIENNHK